MVNETTWVSKLPQVMQRIEQAQKAVHATVTDLAEESIVRGSPLTGSQGQPADLREGQWEVSRSDNESVIGTADPSARSVEDGISHLHGGPITLKSAVGAFHSMALTRLAEPVLVSTAVKRAGGTG